MLNPTQAAALARLEALSTASPQTEISVKAGDVHQVLSALNEADRLLGQMTRELATSKTKLIALAAAEAGTWD